MSKRPSVLSNWDEVQHDPLTLPPDSFDGLSLEEAVDRIKVWFLENFEDPVESTPYDGSEGGYQYIWGGPYDTRDIIENVFADTASSELIKEAIGALEADSMEWVPSSRRLQPPDDDDRQIAIRSPEDIHAEMIAIATRLETLLDRSPSSVALIGHNNPPEETEPYSERDHAETKEAVAILKAQPVTPNDEGKAATEAATVLDTKAGKIRAWLARQGDSFATEAVKEAGKEFGKWAPRAILLLLLEYLLSLSSAVSSWLSTLGLGIPF